MFNIQDILKLSRSYLEQKGSSNPRRESEEVLSLALNLPRLDIYLNFDKPLNDEEVQRCRDVLKRMGQAEPYAYIKGSVIFYDCFINVTNDVLIPRNETELLVDKIASSITYEKSMLDLCTGSGCIAISLKKKFPQLIVHASDISDNALDVAILNAKKNDTDVFFIRSNFLDSIDQSYDLIVSNPPYISEEEYQSLELSVTKYEPKIALVAENNGLYFYEKLAQMAHNCLNIAGVLWLEIGYKQGFSVKKIFDDNGWLNTEVLKDFSGNDRFFKATRG
jgi:release factor glutamine methyltransferase